MGEREQAPDGGSGEKAGHGPEVLDEAREAAMIREILRRQERHREGGVEPELDEIGEEPRREV
jgi:chorismate mutase